MTCPKKVLKCNDNEIVDLLPSHFKNAWTTYIKETNHNFFLVLLSRRT